MKIVKALLCDVSGHAYSEEFANACLQARGRYANPKSRAIVVADKSAGNAKAAFAYTTK